MTASEAQDQANVTETIVDAFKDLEAGNFAAYRSRLTNDFYMFDRGKRFSADVLIAQLQKMEASGVRYRWQVTNPAVHVEGSVAWIAYTNDGRVTTPAGVQSRQWLESAFLQKQGGNWKVAFWHSTPIQPESPLK